MRNSRNRKWLVSAASMAVSSLLCSAAFAQYRVSGDGHALDANNRQGSGGYNDAVNNNVGVNGNDVVVGNVTGGRQFRGGIGYSDPLAFRSHLPGQGLDAFLRDSSGAPQAYSPQFGLSEPRPFFGSSRAVAPPPGSVREGFTGSFVGTSLTPSNPYQSLPGNDAVYSGNLGATNIVGVQPSALPNGLLELPGAIDSTVPNMQSYLSASPLYGVHLSPSAGQDNANQLNDYLTNGSPGQLAPSSLDRNTVDRLQRELQATSANTPGQDLSNPLNGVTTTPGSTTPGQPGAISPNNSLRINSQISAQPNGTVGGNAGSPLGSPLNQPLNALPGQNPLGQPGQNNGINGVGPNRTGAGLQNGLVPPERQSAQYGLLQQRLQQANGGPQMGLTVTSTLPKNAANQANPGGLNNGVPTPGAPAGVGVGKNPTSPARQGNIPALAGVSRPKENAEPVHIESLADGVQAKGLHDLLTSAEESMRQDKFKDAIQQYDNAARVAPNNSLITLGRVNAELGAGEYFRAENDLRRTLASDSVLLMAQLDLKNMFNQKRLDFLKKDLKDLAGRDTKASRPWLLLAYLDYNSGDTDAASRELQEAKTRSGSRDTVIGLMEKYWALSGDKKQPASSAPAPAPELNK